MYPNIEILNDIKGFLDQDEGRRLFELSLEASRQGPCLEIGSYCGKSTFYIGSACKANNSILFAVDHHRGSEEQQAGQEYFDPELFNSGTGCVDTFPFFRKTIEKTGLENTVVPLVCKSEVAARMWATPLSLVFIDGGHAHQTVLTDFQAWTPHIKQQGYLLFHDIFTDPRQGGQAPRQVYQLALESGEYAELPMTKTLGVLQKVKETENQ